MSFKKSDGILLPKNGRGLHKMNAARAIADQDVIEAVNRGLRDAVGFLPSAIKQIVSRTGRNPRTVRNWLNREAAPTAAALIELMREYDEVHDAVLALTNRTSSGSIHPDKLRKAELIMTILQGELDGNAHH